MAALKAGACPQLRRLHLSDIDDYDERVDGLGPAMGEALESGHLRHLEELDLSWNHHLDEHGGWVAIARALQGGACPHLIKLNLADCGLSREDGQVLGEAMRSGSCAKLEDLDLGYNESMGDEGFMAIFEALEAGSYPSLKRLDWKGVRMSVASAIALGHALQSGHCRQLQDLDLANAFEDRDASLCVLQATQQGGRGGGALLPNLLRLNLDSNDMDQEHGRVLGEAIGGGALPKLEMLRLWSTCQKLLLGDGGVVPIMAGLEGGGCRHLKRLEMSGVYMGSQGGHGLARALASGHLNCLQVFKMSANQGVVDEAMAEVIKGLRDKCHRLRKLDVGVMGMGVMAGQALVQALQDKAWPESEKLIMNYNEHLLCDEGVVVGLVGVLERRADLCPRLNWVGCIESGLDKKGKAGSRLARLLDAWK